MILKSADAVDEISKEDFQKKYFKPQKPLLMKGFAKKMAGF